MLIHPLKGYGGGGARSAGYLVQVESDIPDIHRHSLVCVVDLKSGICGLRSHHMCVCVGGCGIVNVSVGTLTFQKYIRIYPFSHKPNWLFFTILIGRVDILIERIFRCCGRYEKTTCWWFFGLVWVMVGHWSGCGCGISVTFQRRGFQWRFAGGLGGIVGAGRYRQKHVVC